MSTEEVAVASEGRSDRIGRRRRRLLVIWNARAGSKAGLVTNTAGEDDLRRAMAENGLGDELVRTESEAEAVAAVQRAVGDRYDAVVAAGGDGTVGLVARHLMRTPVALGILPVGSAMNVARSLGIPRDLAEAARIVATGPTAAIDIGVARDELVFLELASIGVSAEMLGEAHRIDEGHYGGIAGLVGAILRFRPHRVRLTLDGHTTTARSIMIAVANTPYTGLGLTLAPGARMDDGLLDVAVYGELPRRELVRHLFGILAGRHRYSPKITTYRAARVEIDARRPLLVRADDMDLGRTPVAFRIEPAVLRVIVPRGQERPQGDRATPTDRTEGAPEVRAPSREAREG